MTALGVAFGRARHSGGAVLIGHLPAGFPSFGGCIAALTSMVAAGVEVIEVGLPYTDAVLDGPAVAEAATWALRSGTRTRDVLHTVEAVAATGVATVVRSSWDPVQRYGVAAFARDLAGAGAAGLVTPDLIPDEADEWLAASDEHRLDRVFLVTQAFTDAQIKAAAAACRGLVHAAAVTDLTGGGERTARLAGDLVARVRAQADLPVGVGPGVSTPKQANELACHADGVIVGSEFVRRLRDAPDEATGVGRVRALAGALAGAVSRPRRRVPSRETGG